MIDVPEEEEVSRPPELDFGCDDDVPGPKDLKRFGSKSFDLSETGNKFTLRDFKFDPSGVTVLGSEDGSEFKPNQLTHADITELGKLGKGASGGVVVLAEHVKTGTKLAVKKMPIHVEEARRQAMLEFNALWKIHHPNVVAMCGTWMYHGALYLALEFMDQGALTDVLSKYGTMPEEVVAAISYQILSPLAYLKSENKIHRDIKPGNILFNSSGWVKLSDFGIAREKRADEVDELQTALENSDLFSNAQSCFAETAVGTMKYMAPERILNEKYGPSSDVWSFGLTMMECLIGDYPYGELTSFIDIAETVANGDPPSLANVRGSYSDEVKDFLRCCLEKKTSSRSSAKELISHPFLSLHLMGETYDERHSHAVYITENWMNSTQNETDEHLDDVQTIERTKSFIRHLYSLLDARERGAKELERFYNSNSLFTLSDGEQRLVLNGQEEISDYLLNRDPEQTLQPDLENLIIQVSSDNKVLVMITGIQSHTAGDSCPYSHGIKIDNIFSEDDINISKESFSFITL